MGTGRGGGGNSGDGGGGAVRNPNVVNGNSGGDGDTFVQRISELFMKWKVRPDVVLRGRHENKSKGALSAFWQVGSYAQIHTVSTRYRSISVLSGSTVDSTHLPNAQIIFLHHWAVVSALDHSSTMKDASDNSKLLHGVAVCSPDTFPYHVYVGMTLATYFADGRYGHSFFRSSSFHPASILCSSPRAAEPSTATGTCENI